jgi:hypothetical protein
MAAVALDPEMLAGQIEGDEALDVGGGRVGHRRILPGEAEP